MFAKVRRGAKSEHFGENLNYSGIKGTGPFMFNL